MISAEASRYFWDIDPGQMDLDRHKGFIIERILELGDEAAVQWLFSAYSRGEIVRVLSRARSLTAKSHAFWALVLGESACV